MSVSDIHKWVIDWSWYWEHRDAPSLEEAVKYFLDEVENRFPDPVGTFSVWEFIPDCDGYNHSGASHQVHILCTEEVARNFLDQEFDIDPHRTNPVENFRYSSEPDVMTVSELCSIIQSRIVAGELNPDAFVTFDWEDTPRFLVTRCDINQNQIVLQGELDS